MSNLYAIKFRLTTADRDLAVAGVHDAALLVEDHRCIVEAETTSARARGGAFDHEIRFRAASDAEAADLARKITALPGLPPMDAVNAVRLTGRHEATRVALQVG